MPEKATLKRARQDKRAGKAPSTQAGEFVREEIHHVREGKHGARSPKQAIAIGLSKARRAGVKLPPPRRGKASARTTKQARRDYSRGQSHSRRRPSGRRSRAISNALKREGRTGASRKSLARQAHTTARKRIAAGKREKGDQESEIIQTKDGDLDRLVSTNGRALTPEQEAREDERVKRLLNNPNEQRKLQRDREQDAQKSERMLKMLPQAVIAAYGERRGELVELTFKPNPGFQPSTHEGQVFHAMEGAIWVNDKQNRLAEISGRLTQEVKFGLGLLGHLDKGGRFQVKQSEIQPGYWEVTLLNIDMRGRALFFKTIGVQQHEIRTDFQRVPDNL